jgi:hypothetical protein
MTNWSFRSASSYCLVSDTCPPVFNSFRTDAAQQPAQSRAWAKIGHVQRRPLGRAAAETIELPRLAMLLDGLARFHERAKVGAMDEKRSPRVRGLESRRDPSTDRVLVRPDKSAQLADRVAVMEFDAAAIEPPRHDLLSLFDESADVFDLPGRRTRPKFNRLGKAPGFHPLPPRRTADWDRPLGSKNRSQPDEAGAGKIVLGLFRCAV